MNLFVEIVKYGVSCREAAERYGVEVNYYGMALCPGIPACMWQTTTTIASPAENRSRECTCENCGKVFTTTRSDVKYCGDDCRYAAQIKRQGARKKALREAKIEPALPEKETKSA